MATSSGLSEKMFALLIYQNNVLYNILSYCYNDVNCLDCLIFINISCLFFYFIYILSLMMIYFLFVIHLITQMTKC